MNGNKGSGEGEASTVHQQQRQLLDGKFDNYRQEKLKRNHLLMQSY